MLGVIDCSNARLHPRAHRSTEACFTVRLRPRQVIILFRVILLFAVPVELHGLGPREIRGLLLPLRRKLLLLLYTLLAFLLSLLLLARLRLSLDLAQLSDLPLLFLLLRCQHWILLLLGRRVVAALASRREVLWVLTRWRL